MGYLTRTVAGLLCLLPICGCSPRQEVTSSSTVLEKSDRGPARVLKGTTVRIDQDAWEEFTQSRCVVRLDGNDNFLVNDSRFKDQRLAFDAVSEQISRRGSRGLIAFYSKRLTEGLMSVGSMEQLCKEKDVDCLLHFAVGDGPGLGLELQGSRPNSTVELEWTIEASHSK